MTESSRDFLRKLQSFPRKALGFFPTPLVALPSWLPGKTPEIYVKRDDLTGLALGGNKTRKLEFLVGEAQRLGADTLITGGALQSNHCLQTAAAAARSGLSCHLALSGSQPPSLTGNALLDTLFGASLHYHGALRKGEGMEKMSQELTLQGKNPYVIPYGGSNAVGGLGFVAAGLELWEQLAGLPKKRNHVVIATSSSGTQAGLLAAQVLFDMPIEVRGIGIDKEDFQNDQLKQRITKLTRELTGLFTSREYDLPQINLYDGVLGEGYGVVGEPERNALSLAATRLGLLLDPVYTGRAFAGLAELLEQEVFSPEDRVIFWHTGGVPAVFHYGPSLLLAGTGP
ncbi:D-cysteine desulfhydrase family protein [Myxococcota bacterium]|nr:D-cysteine desulfhydrase family protein [Myxococcota bacterium]MBU1533810.1 D-cysteine desulfhydrase family protein [Myxococcota bacterium]